MKIRPVLVLVLALAAAGIVAADLTGDVTGIFNDFLSRLTSKHKSLENLAMPGLEVRAPPEEEDPMRAVILLTFKNPREKEVLTAALEAENISYGSFPDDERLLLFSADMMIFIMQDAIGL
ncbi:MAG: hypothetical protein LBP32_08545 [Spirochaetaceae bacterium]|jgi:hypothetical protein|nr:hypothetical protein [Spirochaetaceae bacterium]